jgi:hypothetical protein
MIKFLLLFLLFLIIEVIAIQIFLSIIKIEDLVLRKISITLYVLLSILFIYEPFRK